MILYGLKGAGKSYFGQKFALQIERPFIDTDTLLGNPRALFIELGEQAFRLKEEEVVASLKPLGAIVAFGGGTMLSPANRRLDLGPLVYLKADKEVLRMRSAGAAFNFEDVYLKRVKLYETLSPYIIDVSAKTDSEVLKELWEIHSVHSFG